MWSPSVPVMLRKSWWLPMAVCLQYLHLHSLRTWKWHLKIVCVHLGATGQAWVPLSFLSMLFSSISHCPGMDQVGWASWSVSPGYTSVSTSPDWDYKHVPSYGFLMWVLGIQLPRAILNSWSFLFCLLSDGIKSLDAVCMLLEMEPEGHTR